MSALVLDWLWALASLPVAAVALYLGGLTFLSAKLPVPGKREPKLPFDIIVPAHNEEAGIGRTVENLGKIDYPAGLRRIVVVADNCSDTTAEKARAAGATVLERFDTVKKGKGYALAHAFERSLADGKAQAVVVVDADTLVSPNLLHAFAARLEAGGRAAQAHYAVLGEKNSWRTQLMAIAFAIFHGVRSNARERLKVSCGLRGNGMCFHHDVLRQVPHDAFSVVEDLEYGIRLGKAGIRVVYAHEAEVYGEMVSTEKASRSQRKRWEGGRRLIAKQHGWPLLRTSLAQRSFMLFDLAMDVLVPPLAKVVMFATVGLVGALGVTLWLGRPSVSLWPWALSVVLLILYVIRGWQISGSGLAGLAALARAPFYIVWKIWLALTQRDPKSEEWVRTAREGAAGAESGEGKAP